MPNALTTYLAQLERRALHLSCIERRLCLVLVALIVALLGSAGAFVGQLLGAL